MREGHFVLRRFAGLTPYNAQDRIRDRRDSARIVPLRPCARWFHYGVITGLDLFRALAPGRAYRAGDVGRRRRWAIGGDHG